MRSMVSGFPVQFDALVAQKTWEAEEIRARAADHQFDLAATSSMYESDPFVFVDYQK